MTSLIGGVGGHGPVPLVANDRPNVISIPVMSDSVVPWLIVAALLIVIVVLAVFLRRTLLRSRVQLATQQAEHERKSKEAWELHKRDVLDRQRGHASEIAAKEERVATLLESIERVRAYQAKGMKWETLSRDLIIDVCDELGLDGVLATNLVFVVPGTRQTKPYLTQLDHVLVTERATLVIENKGWKGVVFDGTLPSQVHGAFGQLFDEGQLRPPFAIQINNERHGPNLWNVEMHLEGDAPCSQVRRQAGRLSKLFRDELFSAGPGALRWVETCVFYSRTEARLYVNPLDRAAGGAGTHVVAGSGRLKKVLGQICQRGDTPPDPSFLELAGDLFERHGADVYGLGRYSSRWRSEFHVNSRFAGHVAPGRGNTSRHRG